MNATDCFCPALNICSILILEQIMMKEKTENTLINVSFLLFDS